MMLWRVICMKAGALREMRSWKRSGDSCLVVRFEFGRAVAEPEATVWGRCVAIGVFQNSD